MDLISMHKNWGLHYFKLGCLLFWAAWFSIAFLTNFFDYLYSWSVISPHWLFRSGDYEALAKVLSIYHTSTSFLHILFTFDVICDGISALLFLSAFVCFLRERYVWSTVNLAFIFSCALWAVFLFMEEIFIAYSFEPTHMRLFMFEIVTLVAIHIL